MIEIVVPEVDNPNKTTKDLVFSILTESEPKTLTQLHREIKKQYKVNVSFQAVIKSVKSLLATKVIARDKMLYSLNKDWIFETRQFFDKIYAEYFKVSKPLKKVELGKDVTIYTVSNLLELDRLWNDLLVNWTKHEQENKINTWKGKHCWWLLPRLQEEDLLHDYMLKKGIKTYNIITSNTPLDKQASKYYNRKVELSKIKTEKNKNDNNMASFGSYILKFEMPHNISISLEKIYNKTKKAEDLDLKEALDIFKQTCSIEVTLIKDKFLANKIQEEITKFLTNP